MPGRLQVCRRAGRAGLTLPHWLLGQPARWARQANGSINGTRDKYTFLSGPKKMSGCLLAQLGFGILRGLRFSYLCNRSCSMRVATSSRKTAWRMVTGRLLLLFLLQPLIAQRTAEAQGGGGGAGG